MSKITLSPEQKKAIEWDKPGPYAVKGIAGCGKTTVGLRRIPFLFNQAIGGDEPILLVTYHKTLVNYLNHLVEKEINKEQLGINWNSLTHDKNIDICTIDQLIHREYLRYVSMHKTKFPDLPKFVSKQNELDGIFRNAIERVRQVYQNVDILSTHNYYFLREEVDYINCSRITTEKQYQVFTRNGRNKSSDKKRNLKKKSDVREAIFRLRTEYIKMLLNGGKMDFPVKRLLALKQVIDNPPKQYTHLIIDECQDLDKTRIDFLKHFLRDQKAASATFLYDNSQSIYMESWLGNGNSFSTLGIDIIGKTKILKKNYRTTFEIQKSAQSLLKADPFFSRDFEPELINKTGVKPFWSHLKNEEEQFNYIVDVINTLVEHMNLKDIIIASRTREELLSLERKLNQSNIDCKYFSSSEKSFGHNHIRLMTLHSVKGLESRAVIVANVCEGKLPLNTDTNEDISLERKLFYVGMTRATEYLYLISYGQASSFINDIDANTLNCVDTINHIQFSPIQSNEVKEKLNAILDTLIAAKNRFEEKLSIKISDNNDFRKTLSELMSGYKDLEKILDNILSFEKEVPVNSTAYDLYFKLVDASKKILSKAQDLMMEKMTNPIEFNDIKKAVEDSFYNFTESSIIAISSAKYSSEIGLLRKDENKIDWGSIITYYSKAIEIELKRVLSQEKIVIYNASLHKILNALKDSTPPLKNIEEQLVYIKFREIRNQGVHNSKIDLEQVLKIQNFLFKEMGVFEQINNLLDS